MVPVAAGVEGNEHAGIAAGAAGIAAAGATGAKGTAAAEAAASADRAEILGGGTGFLSCAAG